MIAGVALRRRWPAEAKARIVMGSPAEVIVVTEAARQRWCTGATLNHVQGLIRIIFAHAAAHSALPTRGLFYTANIAG